MGLNLCPPEMMLLRHIPVSYMGEESFISDAYIPFLCLVVVFVP